MATYIPFLASDKVTQTETLTTSTWTDNTNNLTTPYTGALGTSDEQLYTSSTSSAYFYLNVFNTGSHAPSAEVNYTISYGHRIGCGSVDYTNDVGSYGYNAARAVYSQYRQLIYGDDTTTQFMFGEHPSDHIYVININRARVKHNLKPGSFNLKLSASVADQSQWVGYTGNEQISVELTDDSVSGGGQAEITKLGRQFNIVSGVSGIRSGSTSIQVGGSASFGHFYPDAGVIVLNPDAFGYASVAGDGTVGTVGGLRPQVNNSSTTNTDKNNQRLFNAIEQGGSPGSGPDNAYFILDSEEDVASQYFFARARNNEFNFSNNPTFVNSDGTLKYDSMILNPKVYITTVGLYNENLDLLALAKLSQPITKDQTKEALIRIKLDY